MHTRQLNESERADETDTGPALSVMTDVAGYQLQERIGTGGFGEVWRAIGPGGLSKAVKILFGQHSGQQAETELKALDRMKQLRHPFLLNIERVEVCNDRLIVVTELADGNLEDRFRACVEDGHGGIPRDELIGYLKDAADALDFMSEQHGLQHLDIKPDNLLLQGNHVKVGDFGLAKDISRTRVSIINGFTPLYAPPELFEGRPGRGSDQYSLAIVYQIMLHGAPPFNGRTAAQLTAQHLRSQPDLSSLSAADRPVIARALSKNRRSRYENCRTFVDQLTRRRTSTASPPRGLRSDPISPAKTELVDTPDGRLRDTAQEQESEPVPVSSEPVADRKLYPTVIIGLGGLGGEVVARVTADIQSRYAGPIPAVKGLVIDTDTRTIKAIQNAHPSVSALAIPLRSSQDYRSDSELDLSWLSRRWLFNIPRSGQVESIRPLGRLAFCDHQAAIGNVIRDAIKTAMTKDAVAASSQATGCGYSNESINIVVVASANGGVGSGAVADMGLLAGHVAAELKLRSASVRAVVIHGTGAARQVCDVQEANAVACLKELNQLAMQEPAGSGLRRNAGSREGSPFQHVYLMHFGDGLHENELMEKADDLARYLIVDSTATAGHDFGAWRNDTDQLDLPGTVRLLGTENLKQSNYDTANKEAKQFTSLLLQKWCGQEAVSDDTNQSFLPPELSNTESMLQKLGLTKDTLPQRVMAELRSGTSQRVNDVAECAFQQISDQLLAGQIDVSSIPDILATVLTSAAPDGRDMLSAVIQDSQSTATAASKVAAEHVVQHLRELLNSAHRMEGCLTAAAFVQSQLSQTISQCQQQASEIETAFTALRDPAGSELANVVADDATGFDPEGLRAFCQQYCVLQAYQTLYRCYIDGVRSLGQHLRQLCQNVHTLRAQLVQLSTAIVEAAGQSDSVPEPVIDAVDGYVRATMPIGLTDMVDDPGKTEEWIDRLQEHVVGFLMTAAAQNPRKKDNATLAPFPAGAWPGFRLVGGQRRALVMVPETVCAETWAGRTQREFGDCVAIRLVSGTDVSAVCEISGVPIDRVLDRMTHRNPHISDIASRVHTRIDVDW